MTVKTQLKVKFPQAVITKIRILPPAIPKMSEKLYDGKLGTASSDIMYVKPLICVVGKYLQVQLYLNHSPLRIFFFNYSRNLNIFHKEHLRKAAKAACTYFNVTALQFKIQRRVYLTPN